MSRPRLWKQLTVLLFVLVHLTACHKQQPAEATDSTEIPQPIASSYQPASLAHGTAFFGTPQTTALWLQDASSIGTVTVANDATYLYLTYSLTGEWYLTGVQSYAGAKGQVPSDEDGNPEPERFPGIQELEACDRRQTFTFRVPLATLSADERAACARQYFVAMRATAKKISATNCATSGREKEAWAAPVVINPGGNLDNWATAFFYCQQTATTPPPVTTTPPVTLPPPTWCFKGQGYWFASGKHDWCHHDVVFENASGQKLALSKADGVALWDQRGKRSWAQKAFFKAAALQLSMRCLNNSSEVPPSIAEAYRTLCDALATLSPEDLKAGKLPAGVSEAALKTATAGLGKWLCANSCADPDDVGVCDPEGD